MKYLLLLTLLGSGQAHAFWIKDHTLIASEAVRSLQVCGQLPAAWDEQIPQAVLKADAEEDLNLFRKWTRYSHFYNPLKHLDMRRADSSVTVKEASDAILALADSDSDSDSSAAWDSYRMLGRMIHHLQDASTPPHVVPVNHFMHDGFEGLDVQADFTAAARAVMTCPTMAQLPEPLDLLKATAMDTLTAVSTSFPYTENGVARTGTWSNFFWRAGEGEEFGVYGSFGNQFGKSSIQVSNAAYEVSPSVYREFKVQQMMSAFEATRQAILWAKLRNPFAY